MRSVVRPLGIAPVKFAGAGHHPSAIRARA